MTTQTVITKLTEESLNMLIGKEVRLTENLFNNNKSRCLKKEGSVGVVVSIRPYFEEATVQFGNRNYKIEFSNITINNMEDEEMILATQETKQERITLVEKYITEINEVITEYNAIITEQEKGNPTNRYLGGYTLEMANEFTDRDIEEFPNEIAEVKEKLKQLKENDITEPTEIEVKEIEISNNSTVDNIVNFETEKLSRGIKSIWQDFENKDSITIIQETYIQNLYYYTCGQSGAYYQGWLRGVEYMMSYEGINYKQLRGKVLKRIQDEGRTIVNNDFFEENDND